MLEAAAHLASITVVMIGEAVGVEEEDGAGSHQDPLVQRVAICGAKDASCRVAIDHIEQRPDPSGGKQTRRAGLTFMNRSYGKDDRQGRADVAVIRSSVSRSIITRAYATSPLRLLTPRNAGHGAWVYTSTLGGGLVNGDHLDLDVHIGAGATAFVSSQASTKVYRSTEGTSMDVRGRIDTDACLVLAPDPVVCFAASRYRQTQAFDLARGASLVLVDSLSSGRHGSGERWAFEAYESRIRVCQEERLLVHDSVALLAADGSVASRLGRFDILGIVLLLGPAVQDAAAALVARLAAEPVMRRAEQLVTATAVGEGCLVRFASVSVERAARTVREQLWFVPELLGDDPWSRKW